MISRTTSARRRRSAAVIEDCFIRIITEDNLARTTTRRLKRFGHFRQAQWPIRIEAFSHSQLPGKQLAGQYGD